MVNPYLKILRSLFLLLVLTGSAVLAVKAPSAISQASREIVTFCSIISAAVLASLNGLLSSLSEAKDEKQRDRIRKVNRFWIAFLYLTLANCTLIIIGQVLEWPTFKIDVSTFPSFEIGFLSFASCFLFGSIITVLLFDFVKMISFMTESKSEKSKALERDGFEVPKVKGTNHAGIVDKEDVVDI